MALIWLVAIPFLAGIVAWIAALRSDSAPRWIVTAAMVVELAICLQIWIQTGFSNIGTWIEQVDVAWIPAFGIRFHLALDGLSLLLIILASFLGILATLASWKEIERSVGFFHLNLAWVITGIVGVFLALDLFLFYFAWELMLVPMYFLIAIWGHERRNYASMKFFLFTQLSGLFMLVAIVALYLIHYARSGVLSFDYESLLHTPLSQGTEFAIMLGFLAAFLVKLPAFPFHTWLPDAHTEASTAGSVILAGLMLKTGAYGLIRFVVPFFPRTAEQIRPLLFWLAVIGVLYGAVLAFAQTDLKRLVAYTSVSHLGFVLLGIFTWNRLALEGVVVTMICHGLSTGSLFILAGALQERMHTRDITRMNGLWDTMPRLSGAAMFFAFASIGLPGLGDFVGEVLILFGTFRVSPGMAIAAAIGMLAATLYALRMIQQALHGANIHHWRLPDLSPREGFMVVATMTALLWIGLYPQPVLRVVRPALEHLMRMVS
jgi:NADH-quinone oxidoreductase subunit M